MTETTKPQEVSPGLDDVIVGTTSISHVQGLEGTLSYRGESIDALVRQPFDRVANHVLGAGIDAADLSAALTIAAVASQRETDAALALPSSLHPMSVLQALTHQLDPSDAIEELPNLGEAAHGLTLAARLPGLMLLRATHRQPSGNTSIERLLSQLARDDEPASDALNTVQILQLEHGYNAGTFASRVVASTLAPIQNAIAAGFGALHGVLHGGADQAALETADNVGDPAKAADFVDAALARKDKIMGMGHREYRVVDPRSKHVKRIARSLCAGTPHEQTLATLEAIEARVNMRMAERGKDVHANLEFYKGIVYRALGLPNDLFTATFAFARVYGYIAHFIEGRRENRLIRPAARYVGR